MVVRHDGGCRCGAVRYTVAGEPITVGLCHCTECRKETGSSFLYYADWPHNAFTVTGDYATFEGRSFCARCGSPLFHLSDAHVEIALGSLDEAPAAWVPSREGWIRRREPWLAPLRDASQHRQDPPKTA